MADEIDDEEDGKKGGGILKIVLIAVLVLVLLAGSIGGTLFFSGFFDKAASLDAEEQVAAMELAAQTEADAIANAGPQRLTKEIHHQPERPNDRNRHPLHKSTHGQIPNTQLLAIG